MTGTFEFTLKSGKQCKIVAEYECIMKTESLYADGDKVDVGQKPYETGNMVAYIDGQKYDSCWDVNFWRLIDLDGKKKIWGMRIGIVDAKVASDYEKWLAELMAAGTSAEVSEYKAQEEKKKAAERIKYAEETVRKAEAQKEILPRAELERRMKLLNDVLNEGGEGYLPRLVSKEEYESALEILNSKN